MLGCIYDSSKNMDAQAFAKDTTPFLEPNGFMIQWFHDLHVQKHSFCFHSGFVMSLRSNFATPSHVNSTSLIVALVWSIKHPNFTKEPLLKWNSTRTESSQKSSWKKHQQFPRNPGPLPSNPWQEEAADPVAETVDLTNGAAAAPAAAEAPVPPRGPLARVKTGPQMVRRKVPRWAWRPSRRGARARGFGQAVRA